MIAGIPVLYGMAETTHFFVKFCFGNMGNWIEWIFILHDRQGNSDKTCFGQKQDFIGVAGRNSHNVEGWSVNGIPWVS